MRFVGSITTITVGCEFVQFHSEVSNTSRLEHLHPCTGGSSSRSGSKPRSRKADQVRVAERFTRKRNAAFYALTLRRTEAASIAELVQIPRRSVGLTSEASQTSTQPSFRFSRPC